MKDKDIVFDRLLRCNYLSIYRDLHFLKPGKSQLTSYVEEVKDDKTATSLSQQLMDWKMSITTCCLVVTNNDNFSFNGEIIPTPYLNFYH